MTKEENLLWYNFLKKYPLQFRRQYVIGNFVVDFYCHKAKLVVELDGSQHYEPQEIKKMPFGLSIWNPKDLVYYGLQIQKFCGNFEVFARKSIWKRKIASPEGKLSSNSETDEEYGR